MDAINATASLSPTLLLSSKKSQPRKTHSIKFSKPTLHESLSKDLNKGLVFVSTAFSAGLAKALTYEEALQQTVTAPEPDFDLIGFGTDNAVYLAGAFAVLAVPLVLSKVLKKPKPWGVESVKTAYAKLGDDGNAQLVDIRGKVDVKVIGSPDVTGLGKRTVSVIYNGEDKPGFLKKLALKFKEPENTTLFILDKFDGNSELVAELVTVNGFKAAYAIKDGAEGPRGWKNSGLPWKEPKKTLGFDLSGITESIGNVFGESEGLSVAVGIIAATGLGLVAFTEIETVLQLLGSAAIVQFVSKKLIFSEARKQTLEEFDKFLSNEVAPKEIVDDIKQIGKALLPKSVAPKVLAAPVEVNPEPITATATATATSANSTVQKTEAALNLAEEPKVEKAEEAALNLAEEPKLETAAEPALNLAEEPKVESAAEPALPVNQVVPKAEVKAESHPRISRPLSPYTSYPDLKPPTSPTPSAP